MDSPHKKGAAGGRGAGEVTRRINIVYFLSRGGTTDHRHLFRVNHHSRAGGVRLRDVKRWLSEIRGEGMQEKLSWSYKRKYKAGYVWQDLKDDDLITPVSDNEYVLKGCDVRGTPPRGCARAPTTNSLEDEKKRDDKDQEKTRWQDRADRAVEVEVELTPDDSDESSPKPPPPTADDQDSPRCTVLFKIEVTQDLGQGDRSQQRQEPVVKEVARAVARPASEEQLQRAGSKARGMRVARALHSILTCAAADADDDALRPVVRRSAAEAGGDDWSTPTCPGMDGCGLRVSRKPRMREGGKEQQARRDGGKRNGDNAHKPAALPRCSQCGKGFNPHELHSHMQSCTGFKERMKSSANPRASVDRSRTFSFERHHRSQEQPSPASAVFLLTES